jgi:hypothetical protein
MRFNDLRFILGSALVGGFLLQLGTLAFVPIPPENKELFAQGTTALNTAIGAIVLSLWKSDNPNREAPPPRADETDEPR